MTELKGDLDIYLGKEIVRRGRAWHKLERDLPDGIEVLDHTLAPPDWTLPYNPFKTRDEVLRSFQTLAEDTHKRNTSDGEYFSSLVDGYITMLTFLTGQRQSDPRDFFEEGMEKIAGYRPRLIPYTEVGTTRNEVAKAFQDRYCESFNRDGWQRAFSGSLGIPSSVAVAQIKEKEQEILDNVVRAVGVNSFPRITTRIVNEPDYYIGWVRSNWEGSEFRFNEHVVNAERHIVGAPIRTLLHEKCGHGVMCQCFLDNIKEGSVNPGRGDIPVPGQANWISEGWASNISRIRPEVLRHLSEAERDQVSFAVELQYLTDIGYANAQYNFFASGQDESRIKEDLRELLPHEPNARIDLMMVALTQRLERIFYLPVYGDCSRWLRSNVEPLPEPAKQRFIAEIHRQPMTVAQVKSLV